MNTALQFCRYTLKSVGSLNAVSTRINFEGALVHDGRGYGVLHPWPEFGDPSIEEQLELLKAGHSSKVIERALKMIEVDGRARVEKRALLENAKIPQCHYSWSHHASFEEQMARLLEDKWLAVKSKGFQDIEWMAEWIQKFHEACGSAPLKLRLDFNSSLSQNSFLQLLDRLGEELRGRLDFIEDPFEYDPKAWQEVQDKYQVSLGLDKKLGMGLEGFDYAIFKPARREWRSFAGDLPAHVKGVFTSAMDHGLAQAFAAYEAIEAAAYFGPRMSACGLSTQHLFASDPFFERITVDGGALRFESNANDYGMGFTSILPSLPWQTISY